MLALISCGTGKAFKAYFILFPPSSKQAAAKPAKANTTQVVFWAVISFEATKHVSHAQLQLKTLKVLLHVL